MGTEDTAAAAVTGTDPERAAAAAVADADDHTPATPEQHEPAPRVPAPNDADSGLAELRDMVGTLAQAVDTLTSLVTSNLPGDESPTAKRPWTAYGRTS